ncbi:hypothetical protein KCTCHS21_32860 [Cohnella abietis]|uniref:Uncharacterized protein n=1 Tax=Cohnella abietis TaxID=2507935 RepID=A0A3T1D729_9BACL|nr:hypothetical protein KCTCHS21_32860 [Cohnella abietis]
MGSEDAMGVIVAGGDDSEVIKVAGGVFESQPLSISITDRISMQINCRIILISLRS